MISKLRIERFKCFNDQEIAFKKLTLLAGANATGKSTVIQALLLLRQAYVREKLAKGELPLNGAFVAIGTAKDAWYSGASEESIVFSITENNNSSETVYRFAYPRDNSQQYILSGKNSINDASILFSKRFTYLSAERLGPRLHLPIPEQLNDYANVGTHGEYTFYCLDAFGSEEIVIPELAHPDDKENRDLKGQTQLWMKPIAPNLQIEALAITDVDLVQGRLRNHIATDYLRPTNLGFGISYAIPIVVAGLLAKPDTMLLIENPESHLHPMAQSEMGKFLTRVAAAGVQVILETHSDHILNGIRVAVKHGLLAPEDLSIQFFGYREGALGHTVTSLKIYKDGGIDTWPEGFFDQTEKDLMELF